MEEPGRLGTRRLPLDAPQSSDVVVETRWSGVSTGTERLLFTGRMPSFPGMGYPLVPGYETVGEVVEAGTESGLAVGETVFVPGALCYGPVRAIHGGASSRLVVKGSRVTPISRALGEQGVLLALAATALHALKGVAPGGGDLIVGHGVLGRLLARLAVLFGDKPPVVWEKNPTRTAGAEGYLVTSPGEDTQRAYRTIIDVSGDSTLLDTLVQRLAPGGEIVLAGFYDKPLSFAFAPAFMREARLRVAAQWRSGDLQEVRQLIEAGRLSLEGLVTHRHAAYAAAAAYATAFDDPNCLKMILDWSACQ
jgi:3-hydroxyethyl bacteriochlorophyllide a dehydrogenase